jgi:ADP-heptose:LPS heptosyltransferase
VSAGHVLYARLDNDGDVLLQGPAVRAVAARADRVTLLCGPRGRRAAELLPGVDAIHVHRAAWIDPEPEPLDRPTADALVDELRALGADRAIVSTSFHQSPLPLALLLRMAGVPHVGAISEDYPGSLLDVRHRDPGDVHEVERALSLVEACGFPLPPDDDGRLKIDVQATWPTTGHVVVHPGASVPARAWSPDRNRALVAALADAGHEVVVTGGPDERALTACVAGDRAHDLGGRTDLPALAALIAAAATIVVGNTGPAHLAAAVGTPVVSLFAPTVPPVRWRPYGVPHELLYVDVPCALCRARVCPVEGHPCLSGVSVSDVLAAVERLALVAV